MSKVHFDDFAGSYDNTLSKQLGFFERGTDYFARYKVAVLKRLIRHTPARILDFGCGVGNTITHLANYFPKASITGCDISQNSLAIAMSNNNKATFLSIDTVFSSKDKYDLIFIANVFHHIPPAEWRSTALAVKNLLSDNGELFLFEHNPFNPVTRHLVNTCPFDKGAHLIKPKEMTLLLIETGFFIKEKGFILFFPSFLRMFRPFEKYMARIPLGGQYVVQARTTKDFYRASSTHRLDKIR